MMRQERRRLLDRHLFNFVEDLELDSVQIYLISQGIFTDAVVDKIAACPTSAKSRQALVRAVKERGDNAFDAFYLALVSTRQEHLAALLRPLVTDSVLQTIENRPQLTLCSPPPAIVCDDSPELLGILDDLSVDQIDGDSIPRQLQTYQQHKHEIYPNFASPKGLCLIINNERFVEHNDRKGTHVDRQNLENLFKQLGYKIIVKNDLSSKEMVHTMQEFARHPCHTRSSSTVVIILSHGEEGVIYGSDDQSVSINFFTSSLNSQNAPTLSGKPKLFFIQACRGGQYDHGIVTTEIDGRRNHIDGFNFNPFSCVMGRAPAPQQLRRLPAEADFLIAYATPPQFVSWRNNVRGSWFIQAVCQVFAPNATSMHIVDMLTLVNEKVSQNKTASHEMQIPDFSSRLRKKFYFYPGVQSSIDV